MASAIEVVARPVFASVDAEWLSRLRRTYARSPGPIEFTLVFPGTGSPLSAVVPHLKAICAVTPRIHFSLRSAMIVPDMGSFDVFLVPDEGFGAIIRFHDRVHVGPLADCFRPEMPYIPHLTVATVNDLHTARRLKASLNTSHLKIVGRIDEIEVRQREAAAAQSVARIALAHQALFH